MPPISTELIERLLWEDEGTELDFKRDQYPFARASDDEKSEIIKDIVAFANAWRRSDAFILIGVEEMRGSRSRLHGVGDHLPEAALQQLVNSKTQRPVTFSYQAVDIDGTSIGVIHIPVQERPVYLLRAYGHLRSDTVYIRRGSSTDIAKPDEIARMAGALAQAPQAPLLIPDIAVENTQIVNYRVRVSVTSRSPVTPRTFRVDIQVPDDFAHPTANFERQVRHENGYRQTQTNQNYFPDGILADDRVLIQDIHFKVMPDVATDDRRLQKRFRVEVRADGMPTQVIDKTLAEVLGWPQPAAV